MLSQHLRSGGVNKLDKLARFRRSTKRRKIYGQPIQHIPSLMSNNPANNIGLLHVLAKSNTVAGGTVGGSRTGQEDRDVTIDNGRSVGRMTIQIDFTPVASVQGYYEYAVIKYHRQTTVPAIGTDPVPSSADITSTGL